MRDEAEFNRIVVNSLKASKTIINNQEVNGWGYKISDAAGAYLIATTKSPFDGFGTLAKDNKAYNVYFESKFNKSLSAINLNRIEPHQMESLLANSITPSSLSICMYFSSGANNSSNLGINLNISFEFHSIDVSSITKLVFSFSLSMAVPISFMSGI